MAFRLAWDTQEDCALQNRWMNELMSESNTRRGNPDLFFLSTPLIHRD